MSTWSRNSPTKQWPQRVHKSPNPPAPGAFYDLLGTVLFQKKDLSGADAAFHKAIELDKNNSDALVKLGQVQAAEGSVDQAIALYQQSIKDHPREIAFYILAGEMYESQHDWNNAKDDVSEGSGSSAG